MSAVGKDKLQTLLYSAAKHNTSVEVIGMLIRAGADVESKNEDEMSSLDLATKYNPSADVVKMLLKISGKVEPCQLQELFLSAAKHKDGYITLSIVVTPSITSSRYKRRMVYRFGQYNKLKTIRLKILNFSLSFQIDWSHNEARRAGAIAKEI